MEKGIKSLALRLKLNASPYKFAAHTAVYAQTGAAAGA